MADVVEATRAAVSAFADLHGLLPAHATVVVAVSGGPDSACLLDCLHAMAAPRGLRLHVAHLDHMVREDGSAAADAAYVRDLAARYGLEITHGQRDVRTIRRERRLSLQVAARLARYDFLEQVAAGLGGAQGGTAHAQEEQGRSEVLVATGHTATDQAETVLHHMLRGSGLAGLAGMQPRRGRLVRPLLAVERDTVEAYCSALGLVPRRDPSNSSPAYTRNRLRHELMPILRRYNPRAGEALARAASSLAEDLSYLEGEAARLLPALVAPTPDGAEPGGGDALAIDRHAWQATPRLLRAHLVRALIAQLFGTTEGFGHDHITRLRQILDGVDAGAPGGSPRTAEGAVHDEDAAGERAGPGLTHAQFPRRLWVEQRAGTVVLSQGRLPSYSFAPRQLAVPGSIVLPGGQLSAVVAVTATTEGAALPASGVPSGEPWPERAGGRPGAPSAEPTVGGFRRGRPGDARYPPPSVAYVDADSVGAMLLVRARRPGDVVRPLGMGGHRKKVQDVLVDAHVPRAAREGVPIVTRVDPAEPAGDDIVWVAGYCLAERFKVTASTRRVVCLRWEPASGREERALPAPSS